MAAGVGAADATKEVQTGAAVGGTCLGLSKPIGLACGCDEPLGLACGCDEPLGLACGCDERQPLGLACGCDEVLLWLGSKPTPTKAANAFLEDRRGLAAAEPRAEAAPAVDSRCGSLAVFAACAVGRAGMLAALLSFAALPSHEAAASAGFRCAGAVECGAIRSTPRSKATRSRTSAGGGGARVVSCGGVYCSIGVYTNP